MSPTQSEIVANAERHTRVFPDGSEHCEIGRMLLLAARVIAAARELNKDTQTMDALNDALAALDEEFPT